MSKSIQRLMVFLGIILMCGLCSCSFASSANGNKNEYIAKQLLQNGSLSSVVTDFKVKIEDNNLYIDNELFGTFNETKTDFNEILKNTRFFNEAEKQDLINKLLEVTEYKYAERNEDSKVALAYFYEAYLIKMDGKQYLALGVLYEGSHRVERLYELI